MNTHLLVDAARSQAELLTSMRSFYLEEIVSRVDNAKVSHDFRNKPGTIPIPATMTLEFSEYHNARSTSIAVALISEFPFPWRQPRQLTEFESRALRASRNLTIGEQWEFGDENGISYLSFASPIVMSQGCVECHNTHPDSPKTDWKVGDVRGLQVVQLPVESHMAEMDFEGTVVATLVAIVTFVVMMALLVLNHRAALAAQSLQHRNRDLADARKRADAASQAKSDFLANMSHEIRTPLNGLIGIMQTLPADKLDADSREVFAVMARSARSLKTIVNNILDISKIEAKRMEVQQQTFDIGALINDLTDRYAINFADGKTDLRVDLGETVPRWLNGDSDKLEQILSNLLSNASKFTEEGQVRIDIREIEKSDPDDESSIWLRFVVSDTGIGIPLEQQERLFQPFFQVDGSLTRNHEGTGLGLAIVKELAELMGGSLSLESVAGEGSAFTVDLPFLYSSRNAYAQEQETDPHVVVLTPDRRQLLTFTGMLERAGTSVVGFNIPRDARRYLLKTCNSVKHVFIDESFDEDGAAFLSFIRSARPDLSDFVVTFAGGTETQGDAAPKMAANHVLGKPLGRSTFLNHMRLVGGLIEGETQTAAESEHSDVAAKVATDANKLGVLVVDDNKINQRVLVRLLSQMNLDAEVASSGEAAIERIEQGGIDVVLMDVQMPGMDGYQATAALREKGFDDLTIIACTAHAFETDRELAWENGMDGHIAKPVDRSSLEKLLNMVAARKSGRAS